MPIAGTVAQATTQAPAAPIPPLPARPGAATGGGAADAAADAANAARLAGQAAQDAGRAARDAARAQGSLADEIARGIDQEIRGQGGTSQPPFQYDPNNVIPPEVVPLTGMTLAMIAVIFVGWPLARAFARRMDRRAELGTVRAQDLQPQIRQLQESLDAMAVEIERISETQRFQAKLMSERAPALPQAEKRGA